MVGYPDRRWELAGPTLMVIIGVLLFVLGGREKNNQLMSYIFLGAGVILWVALSRLNPKKKK